MGGCTSKQNVKEPSKPSQPPPNPQPSAKPPPNPIPSFQSPSFQSPLESPRSLIPPNEPSQGTSEDTSLFPDFYYLDRSRESLLLYTKSTITEFPLKFRFNFPEESALTFLPEGLLLSAGGVSRSCLLTLFFTIDIQSKTITELKELPFPCKLGQLHSIGDWVYYIGAVRNGKAALEQAPLLRFNVKNSYWEDLWIYGEKFQFNRLVNMGTCSIGNKLLLVGGQRASSSGKLKNSKKIYSISVEEGFKVEVEAKIPFKVIRPVIACGRKNAVVTGGINPITNRPNRGSFFISRPYVMIRMKKMNNWLGFEIVNKETRKLLTLPALKRADDASSDESFSLEKPLNFEIKEEKQAVSEVAFTSSMNFTESPRKEGLEKEARISREFPDISVIKKLSSEPESESENTEEIRENEIPVFVPVQFAESGLVSSSQINQDITKEEIKEPTHRSKLLDFRAGGQGKLFEKYSSSNLSSGSDIQIIAGSNLVTSNPYLKLPVLEQAKTPAVPMNIENKQAFELNSRDKIKKIEDSSGHSSQDSLSSNSSSLSDQNTAPKINPKKVPPLLYNFNSPENFNFGEILYLNDIEQERYSMTSSDSSVGSSSSENNEIELFSGNKDFQAVPVLGLEENVASRKPEFSFKDLEETEIKAELDLKIPEGKFEPPLMHPPTIKEKSQSPVKVNEGLVVSTPGKGEKEKILINIDQNGLEAKTKIPVKIEHNHLQNPLKIEEKARVSVKKDTQNPPKTEENQHDPIKQTPIINQKKSEPGIIEIQSIKNPIFEKKPEKNEKSLTPQPVKLEQKAKITSINIEKIYEKDQKIPNTLETVNKTKTVPKLNFNLKTFKPFVASHHFRSNTNLLKKISSQEKLPSCDIQNEVYKSQDFREINLKTISDPPVINYSSLQPKLQNSRKCKIKTKIYFNSEYVQKLADIVSTEFKKPSSICPQIKTPFSLQSFISSIIGSASLHPQNLSNIFSSIPLVFNKKPFSGKQISSILASSKLNLSEPIDPFIFSLAIYKSYKIALLKKL